jgi:PRTRC genetic system protein C
MNTPEAVATEPCAVRIAIPTRIFRMGSVDLPDPDPTLTPLRALRLYRENYPHLANARLSEPILSADTLVYEIQKPPVQTKGAPEQPLAARALTPAQSLAILRSWVRCRPALLPAEELHENARDRQTCTPQQIQAIHRALDRPVRPATLATRLAPWLLPPV